VADYPPSGVADYPPSGVALGSTHAATPRRLALTLTLTLALPLALTLALTLTLTLTLTPTLTPTLTRERAVVARHVEGEALELSKRNATGHAG